MEKAPKKYPSLKEVSLATLHDFSPAAVLAPPGGEAVQDGVPGGAAHRARVRPGLHQPRGHPTSLTLNDGIQWLFDF